MTTLMDEAVDAGTTVRLAHTFTIDSVNPVDPEEVNFYAKDPTGAVVPAPTVVRDGVGQYHVDLNVPLAGQWRLRWQALSPALTKESSLVVRRSEYENYSPPVFDSDQYTLFINQNETFADSLFYQDDEGNPVVITGDTVLAQARPWVDGPVTFEFTTAIVAPNQVQLSLTHTQTAALTGSGVYDVWIVDGVGAWTKLIGGRYVIVPSVTSDPGGFASQTWGGFTTFQTWGGLNSLPWGQPPP